jgi:hypothetical protein
VHINSRGVLFQSSVDQKKSYVVSQKELLEGVLSKASKFKKERKKMDETLRRFVKLFFFWVGVGG